MNRRRLPLIDLEARPTGLPGNREVPLICAKDRGARCPIAQPAEGCIRLPQTTETLHRLIGREAELAALLVFIDVVARGPVGLVLQGEPGIGKTTLWRRGLQLCMERGYRVLVARPAEAEAKLSFVGLDDLLEGTLEEALPALAGPKRRAVEIALRRADPEGSPPDRRTIYRGVFEILRHLAREGPLVVAVDDVQWLDVPSARALEFAARRLEDEAVGLFVSRRVEDRGEAPPLGLDTGLPEDRLELMNVPPLGLAETHELLRSRLDATFPRHVLVRLHEQSEGNPFLALEIARVLIAEGITPEPGENLPVPDDLRQLLRRRLAALSRQARQALQIAACLSEPSVEAITQAAAGDASGSFEEAIEAGIVELDTDRIRFTHPLFAAVLIGDATPVAKRAVHARLAQVRDDPEERARHLALAASDPDASLASTLDEAAATAAARGAPSTAAIFSEAAHRLTPDDREDDRTRRLIWAADYHLIAGNLARARKLLEDVLPLIPAGDTRAGVMYRLGTVRIEEAAWADGERLYRAALREAGDNISLRILLHVNLAGARAVSGDWNDAVAQTREATADLPYVDDPILRTFALGTAAWFDFVHGRGPDWDLLEGIDRLERTTLSIGHRFFSILQRGVGKGIILKWTDQFDSSRAELEGRYRRAVDEGDEASVPFLLYHLSELECWSGNWDSAERWAEEGHRIAFQTGQEGIRSAVLYSRGLVAAHRGHVDESREDAEEALRLCEESGNIPVMTLALSVLGFVEVSLGRFDSVNDYLGNIGAALAAMGVGEPGVVRFLPDEVEALIALGDLDTARTLVDQMEERGRALDRIWALATGARCRALLDAAAGDLDAASEALARALKEHERLPMPFELGRTLLVAGTIHRRAKRKRTAKDSLDRALEIFERLGAPLWADKVRHELGRIGIRPSAPLGLTETERRVAELVAAGRTNREVADALFISPKTVESNLSKIYRKLQVRSRTELAARLSDVGHSSLL